MKKTLTICIIIMVLIGAGSFWGGMAYAQSHRGAGTAGNRAAFGATGGARGTRTGGGFVTGSILSINGTSATISLPNNGGSKIVLFASSTAIYKTTTGSASDLQTGTNVMVQGTTNSDGSITAQSVSIRPAGMTNGFGGGNRGQQPSPTATQ